MNKCYQVLVIHSEGNMKRKLNPILFQITFQYIEKFYVSYFSLRYCICASENVDQLIDLFQYEGNTGT